MEKLQTRKKRYLIRIIIATILTVAIIVTIFLTRDKETIYSVKTGVLDKGDISRNHYVTAEIKAGDVKEHKVKVKQKVKEVRVSLHQQVKKGDVLLVLDRTELKQAYENARKERIKIESEIKAEKQAAEKKNKELQKQIDTLTSELSSVIKKLTSLTETNPFILEVTPDLQEGLEEIISNFSPETVEEDLAALIELLEESIIAQTNPEFSSALKSIEIQLLKISSSLNEVLSSLISGDSLLSGLNLTGDLSGLGIPIKSPLEQAKDKEKETKNSYDESVEFLLADTPGLISAINVVEGDYTGPNEISLGETGLESLLGGAIPGIQSESKSAITIFDNTIPQAVFSVGRYDAGRLEVGMPVTYKYEDLSFKGSIINEGKIATSGGISQLEGLDLFAGMGGGSSGGGSFASEPKIELTMSIEGEKLTDLVPGFLIEASIEIANSKDILLLPAEAMRRELNTYFVFLVNEDNTVYKKKFVPGIQSEIYVEVKSGLSVGDKVVLNPSSELSDGNKVVVAKDE